MTLHARKGDRVTCIENNHPMFRITEDVHRNTLMKATHFERTHPALPEPKVGKKIPLCPICKSSCLKYGGGFASFHFEDGFRP